MSENKHFETILKGLQSLQNEEVEYIVFEVDDDFQGYVQFIFEDDQSLKGEARGVEITPQQSDYLKQIGWDESDPNWELTWQVSTSTELEEIARFSLITLETTFRLNDQKDITITSSLD